LDSRQLKRVLESELLFPLMIEKKKITQTKKGGSV